MSKRAHVWLMAVIVVVALLLRLGTLERKSMWLDEILTLRTAAMSVEGIVADRAVRSDPHPPLYYLLMHYWIGLGQSEYVARLPSALAGVVAVPLLYWLVRAWDGLWSARSSAWLLAIAPLHIWYSQEARMYALVCTLGLASALLYTLAIRQERLLGWAAWVVVTTAGLYTDYSMLLLLAVQIILLGPLWRWYRLRPASLWPALVALGLVLLLSLLPLHAFGTVTVSGGSAGYYALPQSLLLEIGVSASQEQLHTVTLIMGAVALVGVTAAALAVSRRPSRIQFGTGSVAAAVVVYLIILIAAAIPRGMLLKRQLLILLPYGLGIIAILVSTQRYRSYLLAALTLITLPLTGILIGLREQEAWRDVAHFLEGSAVSQDIILFHASYMQQPFDYYYRGDTPRQGIQVETALDMLTEIAATHNRVWLVLSNDKYSDPAGKVQHLLDGMFTFLGEYVFPGVRVRLYNTGAQNSFPSPGHSREMCYNGDTVGERVPWH